LRKIKYCVYCNKKLSPMKKLYCSVRCKLAYKSGMRGGNCHGEIHEGLIDEYPLIDKRIVLKPKLRVV